MYFKEVLVNYLETKIISTCTDPILFEFSINETHDDFSTSTLLSLSSFFLNAAYLQNITDLQEFKDILISLKIIKKEIEKLCNTKHSLQQSRTQKLQLHDIKIAFLTAPYLFDDREWVFELLNYLFILSFEEIKFIENLKKVQLNTEIIDYSKPMKIMQCDEGRKLLRRFNKPSMTVDEYVNIVMDNSKEISNVQIFNEDKKSLRKEMESKEHGTFRSGNKNGMG